MLSAGSVVAKIVARRALLRFGASHPLSTSEMPLMFLTSMPHLPIAPLDRALVAATAMAAPTKRLSGHSKYLTSLSTSRHVTNYCAPLQSKFRTRSMAVDLGPKKMRDEAPLRKAPCTPLCPPIRLAYDLILGMLT